MIDDHSQNLGNNKTIVLIMAQMMISLACKGFEQ
jgi:hypothetical protein